MYQKFKDCLLKPRNIADYIKEPKKKTIIYTILLVFIYVLPLLLISILSNDAATSLSSSVADDFVEAEQINYEIKDGKLKTTKDDAVIQFIKDEVIISGLYKIDALYVFDVTGNDYKENLVVEAGYYLIFLFEEDEFKIESYYLKENSSDNNSNDTLDNSIYRTYCSYSYESLDIKTLDFSSNKASNTVNFKNEVATLVSSLYSKIKLQLMPLIVVFVLLVGISNYFMTIMFIVLLFKLLYRYLQIDFVVVLKTIILCSTPYVICEIIATLSGITFLNLVGQFIMILYATKAVNAYKIKYDGGIPMPNYIKKMMGEDKQEKGSDDDEL